MRDERPKETPKDTLEALLRKAKVGWRAQRKNPSTTAPTPEMRELLAQMMHLLTSIAKKYRKLQQYFDKGGLAAEDYTDEVEAMCSKVRTMMECMRTAGIPGEPGAPAGKAARRPKPWAAQEAELRAAARPGIEVFRVVTWNADGSACLMVNKVELRVSASLAAILKRLGESPKEWWTFRELAGDVGIKVPALHERLSRLRSALFAQGSNPFFIETDQGGQAPRVRLALRREASDSGGAGGGDPL
jgi:hypothetical protein